MQTLKCVVPCSVRSKIRLRGKFDGSDAAIAFDHYVTILFTRYGVNHDGLKWTETIFDDVFCQVDELVLLFFDKSFDSFSLVILLTCAVVARVQEDVGDTNFLFLHPLPFPSRRVRPSPTTIYHRF
jgi:hypothetical protein